jgi:hypothetical protein
MPASYRCPSSTCACGSPASARLRRLDASASAALATAAWHPRYVTERKDLRWWRIPTFGRRFNAPSDNSNDRRSLGTRNSMDATIWSVANIASRDRAKFVSKRAFKDED